MNVAADEDSNVRRIAIGLVLVLVVAGGAWWWWQRPAAEPAPEVGPVAPLTVAPAVSDGPPPPMEHPLQIMPEAPTEEPAAPLDPDAAAQQGLTAVFGAAIADWLISDQLARRLVATLDNLPRSTSVEKQRPLRPPATAFQVEREQLDATSGEERILISPANSTRYDALIALLANTDAATAATVYRRIYPQLQAAYEDLGYPGRYFNDRVVAVIDHLLATPEPEGPLLLEQPKVLYHFADPDLEARSAGQKLLLRIGTGHARVVKRKLGEFRALIATQTPSTTTN